MPPDIGRVTLLLRRILTVTLVVWRGPSTDRVTWCRQARQSAVGRLPCPRINPKLIRRSER